MTTVPDYARFLAKAMAHPMMRKPQIKIRETLGWMPHVALREGLTRTLAFYRQHRAHYWA